jgi:hypothetical protein
MPAANPAGEMKHWYNGEPFPAENQGVSPPDRSTMKYWYRGEPNLYLIPISGGGPSASGAAPSGFPALFIAP